MLLYSSLLVVGNFLEKCKPNSFPSSPWGNFKLQFHHSVQTPLALRLKLFCGRNTAESSAFQQSCVKNVQKGIQDLLELSGPGGSLGKSYPMLSYLMIWPYSVSGFSSYDLSFFLTLLCVCVCVCWGFCCLVWVFFKLIKDNACFQEFLPVSTETAIKMQTNI